MTIRDKTVLKQKKKGKKQIQRKKKKLKRWTRAELGQYLRYLDIRFKWIEEVATVCCVEWSLWNQSRSILFDQTFFFPHCKYKLPQSCELFALLQQLTITWEENGDNAMHSPQFCRQWWAIERHVNDFKNAIRHFWQYLNDNIDSFGPFVQSNRKGIFIQIDYPCSAEKWIQQHWEYFSNISNEL